MKKLALIIGLILITIGYLSAQKAENKMICFKSNMDCANCEKTLTEHLKFEKGVKDLKVDHASNTIYVEYREGKNTDENIAKSIEKKGYKAEKISKADYDKVLKETQEKGHVHEADVHRVRSN
jgi:copper chaperone CopZ